MKKTFSSLLLALCACVGLVIASPSAFASHLRGTSVSWSPTTVAGQVQFTIQYSQRTSFGGCNTGTCAVGSTIGVPFNYGDGSSAVTVTLTVTATNSAQDYLSATGTFTHTYTTAGPFIAYFQNSARISTIISGENQYLRMETEVTPFASPANHSPVVSEPAIITVPLQATTGFYLSASDADRDPLSYRMSTAAEMYALGSFTCPAQQPPGLSINANTGQVSWDTTQIVKASGCGFAAPKSGDLWTVQFMVQDLTSTGALKSKVPLDIILQFVSSTEAPPTLTLSNPGPITVQAGTPISFTATGGDAAAGAVITLNATGLPIGATASDLNVGLAPPVVSAFNWTPTAAQKGSYVITYSATNDTFEQVLASVTIYVQDIEPPTLACASPLTPVYGAPISIPLSFTDPQGDAVAVTWSVDGTSLRTDNIAAGSGTQTDSISQTFITLGAHSVGVSATDTAGKTATCSTAITVNPAPQSINFTGPGTAAFGSPDTALMGTATSNLPVSYTASGACSILNGSLHLTGAGLCTVTANQAGNADYSAATPVNDAFLVTQAAQAITFSTPATATYGSGTISLAATGGASGNPVTYTVSGPATTLNNVLTLTGTGSVVVTANQAGSANYTAAPPVSQTIAVSPAAQTITFNPPASVSVGSAPVTLAAVGGASGNPVTYTVTGPATLVGNVLTVTAPGNVVVTANQAGNVNYSAAAAVVKTIAVYQPAQNITFNAPSTATYGQGQITLAATGGASGNPVTFTVTGPATISGNLLTLTGAGNVVVTANQAGNTSYNAATPVSRTIVVSPASQTLTFTTPAAASANTTLALNGKGGASGNPVTYTVTGPATVSGNLLTITGPGTVVITANQAGNANYAAASPIVRSITASVTARITLQAASTSFSYPNSTNFTACVTLTNGRTAGGTVSFYDGSTLLSTQKVNGDGCYNWYLAPSLNAGTHNLTAQYNDAGNVNVFSNTVIVKVAQGQTTAEVDCSGSHFDYGKNFSCDANPDSGPKTGSMTYTYDGGAPISVPLNSASHALFNIPMPAVGTHTVLITYPAQGNYGAFQLPVQTFVVAPAGVNLSLVPSSFYLKVGTALTLNTTLTSWDTTAPASAGTVSFYDGPALLATSPVNAAGVSSLAGLKLTLGYHTLTATYSGTSIYAKASQTVQVQVGQY